MIRGLTVAAISLTAILALPATSFAAGWGQYAGGCPGGNSMAYPGPNPGSPGLTPYSTAPNAVCGAYQGIPTTAPGYPAYQYPTNQYSGYQYPAYQPQSRLGTLAEQTARSDMNAAESAINQRRPIAALTDTGNAETVLLNGQQAGVVPSENRTLAALSAANFDLQTPWGAPAAASALHTALADLSF